MKKLLGQTLSVLFILSIALDVWAESTVWVISSSKARVYLAGSFHMLRASDYPLPAEFSTAYNDSSKIIFEIPPDETGNQGQMMEFMKGAIYTDGTTLKDHISPEAYAKAEKFCRERNYPLELYRLFKPALFVMTLTIQEMNRIGADPQKGVDYYFREKALQDGKATGSLETVDEQLRILLSMESAVGNDQIIESIDEFKRIEKALGEYLAAWRKGDELKMEELFINDLRLYPKLYKIMVVDRNNKWLKDIKSFLNDSKNTMVVVGAAHLVGSDGLINLLRKQGYKLVKLKN